MMLGPWLLLAIATAFENGVEAAAEGPAAPLAALRADPELPLLPQFFSTSIMWNIMLNPRPPSDRDDPKPIGFTYSLYENIDDRTQRAVIDSNTEIIVAVDNNTNNIMVTERVIWRPDFHGVDRFLNIWDFDSNTNERGTFCKADSLKDNSFMEWLFGFDINDPNAGMPSVAGMLHMMGEYSYKGQDRKNGIECHSWTGTWSIPKWEANLAVTYYWSDPERWTSTSGTGKSVPVSAFVEGEANVTGKVYQLAMTIDYTDFFEVEFSDSEYQPPSDLWCEGRRMEDKLPVLSSVFSYDTEIVFTYVNGNNERFNIMAPRTEWYDQKLLLGRTDYKPLDFSNVNDPFDGRIGMVTEIKDFITGLTYTMDKSFGNCSIGYISEDPTGGFTIENGRIKMRNILADLFANKTFAANGVYMDRSIDVDAYIRMAPVFPEDSKSDNFTTVVYLSASAWQIEDGASVERLLPVKVVEFPTKKYLDPTQKIQMNIYGFSRNMDFDVYDISQCFSETDKMHFMVRMGWTPDMDIEKTFRLFERAARETVTIWGKVTPIRVQNIEVDIDFKHKAYFLIFTVLGYPIGLDEEINVLPDAVRPLTEIRDNLIDAVNKGWFQVTVEKNDGNGGTVVSQAEKGSLTVIGDRSGSYSYKDEGYGSGSMAALGIIMLLLTIGGVMALLILVLKW